MRDKALCVIPARGGSERLPGKNTRMMNGKPMIAYTIECALATGLFSNVYVSTDSPEIAAVAREYGALTPAVLPAEIAEPDQASMTACTFMYKYLREHDQADCRYLFCLQPTSPLRAPEDIVNALEKITEGGYEHVASCTPIDPHYFHWAMKAESGNIKPWFGPEFMVDRLYLPEVLRPNGAIKIMDSAFIDIHETFLDSANVGYVTMPEDRSVHVAFQSDFDIAEFLISKRG